ncbi:MAG: alpha/beta hydrolase [Patescibacteria group bacterium]|nr:alpha/beta hydrolase [Patescibacteria group bacterium]MDE2015726.1 alpha/beta hydrolase [Patescibacteria group bacterium]MDE2226783.1 alpha/beta hydrolase [Patescibacteria group bacterium]
MKKIAYIIPGYGESHLRQRGYNKIAKFFEMRGIIPIQVDINWRVKKFGKMLTDYTKQFLKAYKKQEGVDVYILGFSLGATTAFLTAARTKPRALILCSLPPRFKEDSKNVKPAWIQWRRKNFSDRDYSFAKIAPKIKSKIYLLVGENEDRSYLIRAKDAKKKLKNANLTIVKKARHNISQKEYLAAVNKVISKI